MVSFNVCPVFVVVSQSFFSFSFSFTVLCWLLFRCFLLSTGLVLVLQRWHPGVVIVICSRMSPTPPAGLKAGGKSLYEHITVQNLHWSWESSSWPDTTPEELITVQNLIWIDLWTAADQNPLTNKHKVPNLGAKPGHEPNPGERIKKQNLSWQCGIS